MCMVFAYNDCTMSHVDFIYMTVIRQEQLIKIQCDSKHYYYLLPLQKSCYTNVDGIFKYSAHTKNIYQALKLMNKYWIDEDNKFQEPSFV